MESYIVHGDFCHSIERNKLESIKDGYLLIENGKISGIYKDLPSKYKNIRIKDYRNSLIIPGLTDLHTHAPQYQFRGIWMDEELLSWLEKHTFPEEAKYSELSYADKAYDIFVSDLNKTPTTRICCFATLHRDASLMLMDKLEKSGIKGYVGKVNMDRNSPEYLIEDTEKSISDTLSFILKSSKYKNIKPIITPRFIPSCSDKLLSSLGDIAKEYKIPVQSHLSENPGEIDLVKKLVPQSKNYADAYKMFGLWGETPTIMAHAVWSDKFEPEYMKNKNIYIAHCPDSNTNLTSGIAGIKYFMNQKVNIGLGTDIAAGSSLYITKAITDAIHVSKLRTRVTGEDETLTFAEAFYLASIGGGSFFGKTGAFIPGYDADFSVLDESGMESTLFDEFTIEERLERYMYLSPERPVLHKTIGGKELF